MTKKENKSNPVIMTAIGSFLVVVFGVLTTFVTSHGEDVLKKLTNIEETTNETYVETIKTNNVIGDTEIIKEEKIVEPIIQPVIIKEVIKVVEKPVIVEKPTKPKPLPKPEGDKDGLQVCYERFVRDCKAEGELEAWECISDGEAEILDTGNCIRF